ncbi:hypothetical protein GQ44DRAFT_770256 [Phaeosphaeriaceae sp. PMI808]|nr:hypothetical protein GQ44DRAFT_770256 [Phaeosphaeriaceae sp. PMI808]
MAPQKPQTSSSSSSLLHIERISQYVSLSPSSLNTPLPALCASILSPLLLTFFAPANGIVLAYTDVRLSSTAPTKHTDAQDEEEEEEVGGGGETTLLLTHVDEYIAPFLWATASFLIFRPSVGAAVTGRVTHQSRTHVTLAYLNMFPVVVVRDRVPASWTWRTEGGGRVGKGWDGGISDEGGGGWMVRGRGLAGIWR